MKTVLVTGANGQLGNSIHARISQYPGYNFLFTDIDTLDICDKEAVRKYVLENDVQYVIPGREGRAFDLYSFGADGKEGGEGNDADIYYQP